MIYKQWKIEHNSEKIRIKPIKKNIFVQKPSLKKKKENKSIALLQNIRKQYKMET